MVSNLKDRFKDFIKSKNIKLNEDLIDKMFVNDKVDTV